MCVYEIQYWKSLTHLRIVTLCRCLGILNEGKIAGNCRRLQVVKASIAYEIRFSGFPDFWQMKNQPLT